jgi:murein DD-endopeptidase MepM/ murein hydrolase activator NlpD
MNALRFLGLVILLALAACDNFFNDSTEPMVTLAPSVSASAELGPGSTYKVVAGDTVDGVAQQFGVPIDSLIQANHLDYPYILERGQTLIIPGRGGIGGASSDYVVAAGDTLSRIARQHATSVAYLAQLNGLAPPYIIKVGQHLQLPGGGPAQVATAESGLTSLPPPTPAPPLPAAQSAKLSTETLPPPPGIAVAVQPAQAASGDSLGTAPAQPASRPPAGNSAAPIASAGLATSATAVQKNATAPGSLETASQQSLPPASAPARSNAAPSSDTSMSKASAGVAPGMASLEPPAQAPANIPAPEPRGSGKFLWPVNGKVVSPFGPKEGGLHNDGINISAPLGTPVRAAENGSVVYAGNELRGFGNLLLIRHADGWVSAYAHCEALLVKRGDRVRRGQVVARVGQTGAVSSPQLHFELRKGAQAIDPMDELGPQGA